MTAVAKRSVTSLETYSGKYVDLLDPQPGQICLADIAVGLANTCRFSGQVSRWYSVAEHSVRCAERAPVGLGLPALLHDAHEAYTGDITSPAKAVLGDALRDLQARLDVAIAQHFGLDVDTLEHPIVKKIDDALLFQEAAGLKYSHGIGEHWGNTLYFEPLVAYGWTPAEAERRFIDTYRRLSDNASS